MARTGTGNCRYPAQVVDAVQHGLESCIKRLNRYLVGWMGFFGIVDPSEVYRLRKRDAHVRRRLRALQIRQWGRRRHIARHLQRLGAKKRVAWKAVYAGHRSTWALSIHPVINATLRNRYFTERKLVDLAAKLLERFNASLAPAQLRLALG